MTGKMMQVVNAYTREPVEEVRAHTWEECDTWLDQAQQRVKTPLPAWRRLEILDAIAQKMAAQRDELAQLIATEGGKPLTDAIVEADRAVDGVRIAIAALRTDAGEEVPMGLTKASTGRLAFTTAEPIGPVVALSAFNHPLNLIVHQAIPAVAAGCPALVKPADPVPLSALKFEEICRQAGLEDGWLRVAPAPVEVAAQLSKDARVAFLSFIGSAKVGWMLRSNLAPGARCALEHGGAAPVLIDRGADLDSMIPALLKGGFYHAGQVCVSVQRIFAHADMAEEIASRLAQGAAALTTGDPLSASTDVGPLIRPGEVDRVADWVKQAVDGGAKLMGGGKVLGKTTYAPTVLLNPAEDALVSKAEIFGPVICVYSVANMDEAVQRANRLDVAFQASVFAGGAKRSLELAQKLDAATVMIDDHTAFRTDWMPFAGRRSSGHGIGGIGHTMRDMTAYKLIVMRAGD